MPNQDETGPEGKGPLTGRKKGKCEGAIPCPRGKGIRKGRGQDCGRRMGGRANQR
jgi:hypothetical protein